MDFPEFAHNRVTLPSVSTNPGKIIFNNSVYLKVETVIDISMPAKDMSNPFLDMDDEDENNSDDEEEEADEEAGNTAKRIASKYQPQKAGKKDIKRKGPRMYQLVLSDQNGNQMKAIELVPIEKLTDVKPNSMVHLVGPIEIRCNTLLLEPKNLNSVRKPLTSSNPTQQVLSSSHSNLGNPIALTQPSNPIATSRCGIEIETIDIT